MGGHPRRHSRHALSSALDKAGDLGISAHALTCLYAVLIMTCAAPMQTATCAILLSVACLSRMSSQRPPLKRPRLHILTQRVLQMMVRLHAAYLTRCMRWCRDGGAHDGREQQQESTFAGGRRSGRCSGAGVQGKSRAAGMHSFSGLGRALGSLSQPCSCHRDAEHIYRTVTFWLLLRIAHQG